MLLRRNKKNLDMLLMKTELQIRGFSNQRVFLFFFNSQKMYHSKKKQQLLMSTHNIWCVMHEKGPYLIYRQRRPWSESMDTAQIRLHRCACWSGATLTANCIRAFLCVAHHTFLWRHKKNIYLIFVMSRPMVELCVYKSFYSYKSGKCLV